MSEEEIIDLDKEYDAWENLRCAWNNKRTPTERQYELRRAMYTEGMIRFFELYAKYEMGSSYISDIKNIALYVYGLENFELRFIRTFTDVYNDLEDKLINYFKVRSFIKVDDDYF